MSDETSKLATECRPEEIAFFRLLVRFCDSGTTADGSSAGRSYNDGSPALVLPDGEPGRPHLIRRSHLAVDDESASSGAHQGPRRSVRTIRLQPIAYLRCSGWLHLSSDRLLTLSTRSLAELTVYLRDTFSSQEDDAVEPHDEVHVECTVCMSLVTLVRPRSDPRPR